MSFVPVIPTVYQHDRVDLNDALVAIIDAFILSEDYEVGRRMWSEMPDSLTGEGPFVAIGNITESVTFTAQLVQTTFSGSLYYCDWYTNRQEYGRRVDRWADRMRGLFEVNRSTVNPSAVLQQSGLTEGELVQGGLPFGAPQLAFTYTIMRGDLGGSVG